MYCVNASFGNRQTHVYTGATRTSGVDVRLHYLRMHHMRYGPPVDVIAVNSPRINRRRRRPPACSPSLSRERGDELRLSGSGGVSTIPKVCRRECNNQGSGC